MALTLGEAAVLGAVGGVLPDVIKLVRKRFQKRPGYLTSWFYWVNVAVLAGVGAIVAGLRNPKDAVEAVSYGAAALAFLTQIFALPDDKHLGVDRERVGAVTQIRRWWGS